MRENGSPSNNTGVWCHRRRQSVTNKRVLLAHLIITNRRCCGSLKSQLSTIVCNIRKAAAGRSVRRNNSDASNSEETPARKRTCSRPRRISTYFVGGTTGRRYGKFAISIVRRMFFLSPPFPSGSLRSPLLSFAANKNQEHESPPYISHAKMTYITVILISVHLS